MRETTIFCITVGGYMHVCCTADDRPTNPHGCITEIKLKVKWRNKVPTYKLIYARIKTLLRRPTTKFSLPIGPIPSTPLHLTRLVIVHFHKKDTSGNRFIQYPSHSKVYGKNTCRLKYSQYSESGSTCVRSFFFCFKIRYMYLFSRFTSLINIYNY